MGPLLTKQIAATNGDGGGVPRVPRTSLQKSAYIRPPLYAAVLLVGRLLPVCFLLAPGWTGASAPKMLRRLLQLTPEST